MNEEFKDLKFYRAPPVKPRAPIPPAPKKEAQGPSICFIDNPKSLPTDLRKFERPRQYYDQVKLLPKLPYKAPVLLPVKNSKESLKAKVYALRGSSRDPPLIERHVMQTFGTKLKKINTLPLPLQLKRKIVADPSELAGNEEDTKPGALTSAELRRIAPDGGGAGNKRFQFKKKTRQIFEHDSKARELRQREANPWVLESDASSATPKEELRGTVEGGSTARYVALIHSKNGGFTVRPIKRIYNFQPRPTYHIPTAEETETLLNAKKKVNMDKWFALTRTRPGAEDGYNEESSFNAVERDEVDEDEPRAGADDIEDLDFDEDFQDDEEMGLESVYEDTKENEEKLKKKQKRLNPTSDSTDEDEADKKPTDSSVKKLKRMVKTGDANDSDSDSNSEPDAPIKKMEVPVDPKLKPKIKPVVKPSSSAQSGKPHQAPIAATKPQTDADSQNDLTPQFVAMTVKKNPGITMKDLIKKLGLNTLKISSDEKKKVINMLNAVLQKPKNGEPLQLHSDYA